MQRRKTNQFKSLQRLHTAMLAGMVLFCVVSAVVHLPGKLSANALLGKILQVTILAIAFISIKTGISVSDRKLQAIPSTIPASEKFRAYRIAVIIKWVLIEIPVLFAVGFFIVTRNYAFIVLAFAMIIFFALQAPSRIRIMLQLQLSEQEAMALQ